MCLPVAKYCYKVEREWEHAGLKCAVVQAREGQYRCGYVRVPPTHPAYGHQLNSYHRADSVISDKLSVHGGITFSEIEPCSHEDGRGFWFGFDCAHAGDAPYDPTLKAEDFVDVKARYMFQVHKKVEAKYPSMLSEHYWTHDEVVNETEQFAEQLAAITEGKPTSVRAAKRLLKEKRGRRMFRRQLKRLMAGTNRLIGNLS